MASLGPAMVPSQPLGWRKWELALAGQMGPKSRENCLADGVLRPLPFRVPLGAEDEAGPGPPNRLDLSIGRGGFDGQARGQPVDALAMQGIYKDLALSGPARQHAPRRQGHGMSGAILDRR